MVKISIFKEKDESTTPASTVYVIRRENGPKIYESSEESKTIMKAWFYVRVFGLTLVKPW